MKTLCFSCDLPQKKGEETRGTLFFYDETKRKGNYVVVKEEYKLKIIRVKKQSKILVID